MESGRTVPWERVPGGDVSCGFFEAFRRSTYLVEVLGNELRVILKSVLEALAFKKIVFIPDFKNP